MPIYLPKRAVCFSQYTALAMEMTKNYGQKEYYEVILKKGGMRV
jgi:hypothetical protein